MVHKNFKPDQTIQRASFLNKLLGRFGLILTNFWVQLVVILATGVFLSIGVWGTMSLTQVVVRGWRWRV